MQLSACNSWKSCKSADCAQADWVDHLGCRCQFSDGDAYHAVHVADAQGSQSLSSYGEAIVACATCCIYPW